jgi:putative transcriptional regulator
MYIVRCHLIGAMIRVHIDELLRKQNRTFYWLAKTTGVSHTTLWRLKKDKAQGLTFNTLESICQALKCQPGDVLKIGRAKKKPKAR